MKEFLPGALIGLSIAAPVGPIGVLCIRRSLTHGRTVGFVSGLGAATADAVYALIAALGLTALTRALVAHTAWLQLAGGAFMLGLGLSLLRAPPRPAESAAGARTSLLAAFASTFALTLTNPMTILSFIGIFAGLGAETFSGGTAVLGVFLGSAAWWLFLATAAGWFSGRLQRGGLRVVNIASGVIIAGFGAAQIFRMWL
jgi:threonine/homoserine/homoserine lactone efflux protein